jgi:hypothetical protein
MDHENGAADHPLDVFSQGHQILQDILTRLY